MDEADEDIILSIIKHLNEHRKTQWIDIHNLRIIQYGNKLHIDCHITLPWYYTLEQAHNEIEEVAALINQKHSSQVEFFIHTARLLRYASVRTVYRKMMCDIFADALSIDRDVLNQLDNIYDPSIRSPSFSATLSPRVLSSHIP